MFHNFSQFRYASDSCWICGSNTDLTREHKVKASDLKRHFPNQQMVVVQAERRPKFAQGPSSASLKFEAKICNLCNSSRTQKADVAYDQFIEFFRHAFATGDTFEQVMSKSIFTVGSVEYLNLFRYFGKLLGNQLADSGAPIPKHLCRFVIGRTNQNCIWITGRSDPRISDSFEQNSEKQLVSFAAHGGLAVIVSSVDWLPKKFHSTLTVGQHQIIFHYELPSIERLELKYFHDPFVKMCAKTAKSDFHTQSSLDDLKILGLERNLTIDEVR